MIEPQNPTGLGGKEREKKKRTKGEKPRVL